jgi:hypothetical protein
MSRTGTLHDGKLQTRTGGVMEPSTEIEFNVDEHYENEKGVFKVVSIHRDQMVIRWADGEETRTDIALQRRIIERRQWEKRKRLEDIETAKEARRKAASKTPKPVFGGLVATDFKTSVYRTIWRARYQLGGAVTKEINTNQFEFNSWAFGSQPEMHVQDIRHRDAARAADQPKFFVRIDPQALTYGFRATRPEDHVEALTGWPAVYDWLSHEGNAQAFHAIAIHYHLSACNRAHPTSCIRAAADDGGWLAVKGEKPSAAVSLPDYFDASPPEEPLEFELFATLSKDDAVACGRDIASKIARLFTDLLPLYQAATTP